MYYKHGHAVTGHHTYMYVVWRNMRARCMQPSTPRYKDYGGRGIKICKRWDNFENFLEDMGERPPGHVIDRIDNDGNYEPNNVRWATKQESAKNKRPMRQRRTRPEHFTTAELKAELARRQRK